MCIVHHVHFYTRGLIGIGALAAKRLDIMAIHVCNLDIGSDTKRPPSAAYLDTLAANMALGQVFAINFDRRSDTA